jgi:hypothetical protein
MGRGEQFYTLSFCSWEASREQETDLGVGAVMEGKL